MTVATLVTTAGLLALSDRPVTAAGEYQALTDEYRKALKESEKVFEKAATAENRQKIRTEFQTLRSKIVGRFLAFAETLMRVRAIREDPPGKPRS